jgi:hypothetical protein
MLDASIARIERDLDDGDVVLDVGGWAKPLSRADWVIDLMPYETRGLYGELEPGRERFRADTWVTRDICDHEPWPFADDQFDFAVCSHTLEDIRDPVWVCRELARVARAGYLEVPSRLVEQTYGVHGPWVGWSHHHWLVDVAPGAIEFVFKPGVLQGRDELQLAPEAFAALAPAERVQTLWWEGGFEARERVFLEAAELDEYLAAGVREHRERHGLGRRRPRGLRARLAGRR